MAHPTRPRLVLDGGQAAILRRLVAAFGAGQVTAAAVQPTTPPGRDPTAPAPSRPTLPGEAS